MLLPAHLYVREFCLQIFSLTLGAQDTPCGASTIMGGSYIYNGKGVDRFARVGGVWDASVKQERIMWKACTILRNT